MTNNYQISVIEPKNKDSVFGSGLIFKNQKFITHNKLPYKDSAVIVISKWQKIALLIILGLLLLGLIINPLKTGIILIASLSAIYFIDVLFNLYVIFKSLQKPPEIRITNKELKNINNEQLPVYSILCPLFRESAVLPQFLNSINKLKWPKDKLDVLLLLEENDQETIDTANSMELPSYVKVIIVPHSLPKTKPKACNYGLHLAKGEYVVIYDAEDMPDPWQLKKAYLAFKRVNKDVICLQAKLNYYNTNQNLLTQLFTAEYSLWFDIILPGLQSIDTIIPLGGTSNHFIREGLVKLHGWDPFNVTEDCDLGVRLFKKGYKTAIFNSTTYEEANSNFKNWVRQRSRWIKGYWQTYLVHTRDPWELVKKCKTHSLFFQLIIGLRISFILINPILWITTASYFIFYEIVGPTIEILYPTTIFYMAGVSLIFGNFIYLYNYMIGCAKKKQWSVIKYVFLVPIYWFCMSFGASLALYQLIFKPYFWEKTIHGFHLKNEGGGKESVNLPLINLGNFRSSFLKSNGEMSLVVGYLMVTTFNLFDINLSKILTSNMILIMTNLLIVIWVIFFSTWFLRNGKKHNNKNSKNSLNILIFNWYDIKHKRAGGGEIYLYHVAKYLIKSGHNVTIFCGNDNENLIKENVKGINIIRKGGIYTVAWQAFIYYMFNLKGKYDLVVDTAKGVPFFTPLYVKEPIVGLYFHNHKEMFMSGLKSPFKELAIFLESKLMPLVYKNIDFVTISESSKNDLLSRGLVNEGSVEIINPGINIYKAEISKTKYPSIIYLGRLRYYKNVDVLILSILRLKKIIPSIKLFVVGSGDDELRLKEICRQNKLNDNVIFTGRVNEKEKTKLLTQSWVAVQPSIIEGWGITNIEANKCGTPVVASDVGGLSDSVINGVTGLLVKPNNINELSDAILTLIKSPELRMKMGKEAESWAHNFSWSNTGNLFTNLILQKVRPEFNKNQALEGAI